MAALNVEVTFEAYRVALAAGGVKAAKLPPRLKIPRPGVKPPPRTRAAKPAERKKRPATLDEVKALLARAHRRT